MVEADLEKISPRLPTGFHVAHSRRRLRHQRRRLHRRPRRCLHGCLHRARRRVLELLYGGHRHDIDDDSDEDAGVGSAASQRRQPNRLWWQLESTRMTTSRVPPAEAAATAGLSRAVPSAVASASSRELRRLAALLCVPAPKEARRLA